MAYIVKGDGMPPPPRSPLARADFSRQRDTYVLAKRFRNKDCMRLWGDFAAEQPAMARLIVADVEAEDRDRATVNEAIDKRLVQAEKMVTKARKAQKTKVLRPDGTLTKAGRRGMKAAEANLAEGAAVWLESCNPAMREMARKALESRGQG